MRLMVVGAAGQLARSLKELPRPAGIDLVSAGRPQLDLLEPASISRAFSDHAPDLIVNAAAYTAVDKWGYLWRCPGCALHRRNAQAASKRRAG